MQGGLSWPRAAARQAPERGPPSPGAALARSPGHWRQCRRTRKSPRSRRSQRSMCTARQKGGEGSGRWAVPRAATAGGVRRRARSGPASSGGWWKRTFFCLKALVAGMQACMHARGGCICARPVAAGQTGRPAGGRPGRRLQRPPAPESGPPARCCRRLTISRLRRARLHIFRAAAAGCWHPGRLPATRWRLACKGPARVCKVLEGPQRPLKLTGLNTMVLAAQPDGVLWGSGGESVQIARSDGSWRMRVFGGKRHLCRAPRAEIPGCCCHAAPILASHLASHATKGKVRCRKQT